MCEGSIIVEGHSTKIEEVYPRTSMKSNLHLLNLQVMGMNRIHSHSRPLILSIEYHVIIR